jgi:hypothetical protein
MASEGFTYAPIYTLSKGIRLLRLSDRYTPGPPSCEISHASLDDDIKYEALSYTWGDSKLQDFISLNGNITSVTVNLTRALEDIRLDHGTRVLWVDALCINQEDTTERNHQVKQMGAIYQKAERVVVWLGRPKIFEVVNRASVLDSLEKPFDPGLLEYSVSHLNLKAKWQEVFALCELPYWHRLWIVQEIGLAAELHVYHGRSYKDWKLFSKIRTQVEHAKKNITLHESLQGIAKAIMESVPGRLDQQREYRQPLWLGEMHAAMEHLFSRAQDVAMAAKILSEVWDFAWKLSHGGRTLLRISEQANPSSTKESKTSTIGFGIITSGIYVLEDDPSYFSLFSKEVLASIANGDFESNKSTEEESIVTIPCFLPLDVEFAEACNNLPRHIEYVRAHERQGYHEKLKYCHDDVSQLECYTNFSHLAEVLAGLTRLPRSYNQRFFQTMSREVERAEREWKLRRDQLQELEQESKLHLERFRLENTEHQRHLAYFENLEKGLEKEELRCRSEVEKIELQLEEIKVMDRGVKFLNARYQEVNNYLEACEKFYNGLRDLKDFSQNLESFMKTQQPAFALHTLLETCERSLCQDPRDKVYGLLGLASNVRNDEMQVDYSKSMFELFWDVVWHTYKQREGRVIQKFHRKELIRFSQLMQRSLGGPFSVDAKFKGYLKPTEPRSPQLVHLPGFITGTVLVLEFGDSEPGAALCQNQAETLKEYFRGQARQSSIVDMVVAALEKLQHVNRDRLRQFTVNYSYGTTEFRDPYHAQQESTRPTRPMLPKAQPVLFVKDSGMIGLASCNVRSDDLLVQFRNCDIAAIIRRCGENETEFRLVGRAVVARQLGEKRKTVSESSPELFKYAVPDNSTRYKRKVIWLWLDAVTLQELTCPVSERREYNFDTLGV